jgi:hypothetical protein
MDSLNDREKEAIQKIEKMLGEQTLRLENNFECSKDQVKKWQDMVNDRLYPVKFTLKDTTNKK